MVWKCVCTFEDNLDGWDLIFFNEASDDPKLMESSTFVKVTCRCEVGT